MCSAVAASIPAAVAVSSTFHSTSFGLPSVISVADGNPSNTSYFGLAAAPAMSLGV